MNYQLNQISEERNIIPVKSCCHNLNFDTCHHSSIKKLIHEVLREWTTTLIIKKTSKKKLESTEVIDHYHTIHPFGYLTKLSE